MYCKDDSTYYGVVVGVFKTNMIFKPPETESDHITENGPSSSKDKPEHITNNDFVSWELLLSSLPEVSLQYILFVREDILCNVL